MEIMLSSLIAAGLIFLFVKYATQKGRNFMAYPDILIAGMAGIAIGFILNIEAIFFAGIIFSIAGILSKAMSSRNRVEKYIKMNEQKIFAGVAIILLVASLAMFFPIKQNDSKEPVLNIDEAMHLAQISDCGINNSITGNAIYYETAHYWRVEMVSNDIDLGSCHPVCLIDETTRETRTIWVC